MQPQCDSTSPLLRVILPMPTRPLSDEDAPAQAEFGKTECETADARTASAERRAAAARRVAMRSMARKFKRVTGRRRATEVGLATDEPTGRERDRRRRDEKGGLLTVGAVDGDCRGWSRVGTERDGKRETRERARDGSHALQQTPSAVPRARRGRRTTFGWPPLEAEGSTNNDL